MQTGLLIYADALTQAEEEGVVVIPIITDRTDLGLCPPISPTVPRSGGYRLCPPTYLSTICDELFCKGFGVECHRPMVRRTQKVKSAFGGEGVRVLDRGGFWVWEER